MTSVEGASTLWQRILWTAIFVVPFVAIMFAINAWSEANGFGSIDDGRYGSAPVVIFSFVFWPVAAYVWFRRFPNDERWLPFVPRGR